MKIATYNVNGVNGRLPVLLRWLKEAQPDIVCLQELKAQQEKFPLADSARPDMARSGMDRRPGMVSRSLHAAPTPSRRGAVFRRPGGHPQPLYRGGRRRANHRLPLPTERQSRTGTEIRLQARLV
jgi:hypothetical protein